MRLFRSLQRFAARREGGMSVEFVIIVPFIFSAFMFTFEVGWYMTQQMMLYRGTDMAMREVKLASAPITNDAVRSRICEAAVILPDCGNKLFIEMQPVRGGVFPDRANRCVDSSGSSTPVARWEPGRPQELVMVRVCHVTRPIFPGAGIGAALLSRSPVAGHVALTAFAAFINEPSG